MKRIAIFASGRGSNAKKIIEYFKNKPDVQISLIVSNKATAAVLDLAKTHQIPSSVINRQDFYKTETHLEVLKSKQIDLIVLAGFLWLIPSYLTTAYPQKIINIHPALLPKFGGKGMYGQHVHQAVFDAKETTSGITVHFVNEQYDEGAVILQATCALNDNDTPSDIAKKVLSLEHHYFPVAVEKVLMDME